MDGPRLLRFDMSAIVREVPGLGESGRVDTFTLGLTAEHDDAGTWRAVVQNLLSARP